MIEEGPIVISPDTILRMVPVEFVPWMVMLRNNEAGRILI